MSSVRLVILTAIFCCIITAVTSAERPDVRLFPVLKPAETMVDDLLLPQGGLANAAVIDVMKRIPRNKFVDAQHQPQAYWDQALAIGHKQTISPPYIVAFMTQELDPKPTDKVLEIGTGSGYQAAVLSLLVDTVYSIEIIEPLGKQAAKKLKDLGFKNVHVRIGDGYKGWQEVAPFDSIIVTCSPDAIPQPLVDQLKDGGRMIIPVGERYQQAFYLCKKVDGKLQKERLQQVLFVPMTGEAEDKRVTKNGTNNKTSLLTNGNFKDRNEDGTPNGWHYVRNAELVPQDTPSNVVHFTRQKPKTIDGQLVPSALSQILQGFALDGSKTKSLHLEYDLRGKNVTAWHGSEMTPTVLLSLTDENRKQIAMLSLGRCIGTFDWKRISQDIAVPPKTKEAFLLLGLPMSSGHIDIRDVKAVAE